MSLSLPPSVPDLVFQARMIVEVRTSATTSVPLLLGFYYQRQHASPLPQLGLLLPQHRRPKSRLPLYPDKLPQLGLLLPQHQRPKSRLPLYPDAVLFALNPGLLYHPLLRLFRTTPLTPAFIRST
jgi:hypothetical protein